MPIYSNDPYILDYSKSLTRFCPINVKINENTRMHIFKSLGMNYKVLSKYIDHVEIKYPDKLLSIIIDTKNINLKDFIDNRVFYPEKIPTTNMETSIQKYVDSLPIVDKEIFNKLLLDVDKTKIEHDLYSKNMWDFNILFKHFLIVNEMFKQKEKIMEKITDADIDEFFNRKENYDLILDLYHNLSFNYYAGITDIVADNICKMKTFQMSQSKTIIGNKYDYDKINFGKYYYNYGV